MRLIQYLILAFLLLLCFSGQAFAYLSAEERKLMEETATKYVAEKENQDKAQKHYERAGIASAAGNQEQALKELDTADLITDKIEGQSEHSVQKALNQYRRAHVYSQMGMHERARSEYVAGFVLNPNKTLCHYTEDHDFQVVYWTAHVLENLSFYAVAAIFAITAISLFVYALKVRAFLQLISIALCTSALFDSGESDLLTLYRFGACATLAGMAFQMKRKGNSIWCWIYGTIAVLFNPIARIELERDTWQYIDLAVIVIVAVSILAIYRFSKKPVQTEIKGIVEIISPEAEASQAQPTGAIGRQLAKLHPPKRPRSTFVDEQVSTAKK